ncbi:DNA adenine methylase [Campylobacter gastrosuis]|uniref:DNA adenine methylase n=1 Tax=Campylobacter gastrosuis TaxID=2974576 RepID=UPI003D78B29E
MNYIGSKLSLLSFLDESINLVVGDLSDKIFCDIFAGTGDFKNRVKKVILAVF